jgi:hypothetical protein
MRTGPMGPPKMATSTTPPPGHTTILPRKNGAAIPSPPSRADHLPVLSLAGRPQEASFFTQLMHHPPEATLLPGKIVQAPSESPDLP